MCYSLTKLLIADALLASSILMAKGIRARELSKNFKGS